MNFKKVRPEEHGKLLFEMDIAAFCREYDYPTDSIAHTLEYLLGSEVYLAEENDRVIGTFSYKEKVNGVIELIQLIVLPEFQGRGYGKRILLKFFSLVKNRPVILVTHPRNSVAIILYLKNGFVIDGWKNDFYGDGQPRLLFSRK